MRPPKGLAKGLFLARFDVEGRVAGFHGGRMGEIRRERGFKLFEDAVLLSVIRGDDDGDVKVPCFELVVQPLDLAIQLHKLGSHFNTVDAVFMLFVIWTVAVEVRQGRSRFGVSRKITHHGINRFRERFGIRRGAATCQPGTESCMSIFADRVDSTEPCNQTPDGRSGDVRRHLTLHWLLVLGVNEGKQVANFAGSIWECNSPANVAVGSWINSRTQTR
mmetsp:Transcript_47121/g.102349  ORF Transcript_47121/g.102349 Transcript_47121/m.102349 type:complete len:219 (-) Transcript_47121:54-710(-)